jgi:hypothetical protein
MAHLTLAADEKTFIKLFERVRDEFEYSNSGSADFGPFSAGYSLKAHLEGGSIDLRADHTVSVKELDVKWDVLDLWFGIDIPEICVGGFCIIPKPWGGCFLRAPKICVFSDDPDITLTLPLGGIITTEISMTGSLYFKYFVDPARAAWMDDWDAAEQNPSVANRWQLLIDPQTIDLDLFDIPDMVGDLLQDAADAMVDTLLGWLPGWAKSIVKGILGSAIDLIRDILDIPDDIQEWISDLLNVSFGIGDLILTFIADWYAKDYPLFELEDPYSIMDETTDPNDATRKLVAVKIPIRDLAVTNDDDEMVLTAKVG